MEGVNAEMLIGMRIIKTVLAVTISAYLAILLKLDSPFFAAMAALITMQGNLVDSFSMAKYRIIGTIFGAAIGFCGAYFAHGNPIILGLGIGLIIFVGNKLRWNKAIAIASIVFASIMLGTESLSIYASANRVIDTLVGIAVAVVVNYTISRPHSRDKVINSATGLIKQCKTVLGMLICSEKGVSLTDITEGLKIIEKELPGLKTEIKMHIVSADLDMDFDTVKAQIDKLYQHIALLAEMDCTGKLNAKNAETVNRMYGVNLAAEKGLDEASTVFNYHLGTSLRILDILSQSINVAEKQENGQQAGKG